MPPDKSQYIGWGSLALINAVLAQSKNRSGFVWCIISLFIGPLATLILAVMDRLPPRKTS